MGCEPCGDGSGGGQLSACHFRRGLRWIMTITVVAKRLGRAGRRMVFLRNKGFWGIVHVCGNVNNFRATGAAREI